MPRSCGSIPRTHHGCQDTDPETASAQVALPELCHCRPIAARLQNDAAWEEDFTAKLNVSWSRTVGKAAPKELFNTLDRFRDPDARTAEGPDVQEIEGPDASRHVAFGKGLHVCLGETPARVEGQIAFQVLFGRYPDLRLPVPEEEIQWGGSFLRSFREIPLLF